MYSQLHKGKGIIYTPMPMTNRINSNGLTLHQRRLRIHVGGKFLIVNSKYKDVL